MALAYENTYLSQIFQISLNNTGGAGIIKEINKNYVPYKQLLQNVMISWLHVGIAVRWSALRTEQSEQVYIEEMGVQYKGAAYVEF